MRTALIASLSLVWMGGAALAETNAPALSDRAPSSLAQAPARPLAATPVKATKRVRNGKANRKLVAENRPQSARGSTSAAADALSSCLAMWEPATHMTKREWARACQRVAERLKDTTLR
jgi:hypothetical protein